MILKIHKALSRLMEGHSQVSPSRWAFVWPSGTGATNILPIRLYKLPQDLYTRTHTHSVDTLMLYTAVQVCDVEGYPPKKSLNREHTQSISLRSTKVQQAKRKTHTEANGVFK